MGCFRKLTAIIVIALIGAVLLTAGESNKTLLSQYEPDYKEFKEVKIGNKTVHWRQRMIDDAVVEGDHTIYQFDKNTKKLINKKTHLRDGLPEHLPANLITKEQAESMVEGEVRSTKLYIISPESNVFPIKPTPKNPCWIIRSIDNGRPIVTIIDAVDGKILGYGVPPPSPTPYTAFSLAGPTGRYDGWQWTAWYKNAETWFNTMGYSTEAVLSPTEAKIQSHIQSSTTAMFYEIAHGDEFAFGGGDGYTNAREIKEWIADYTKMPFTFIGSCNGMCYTDESSPCYLNTLSYEFRKGSATDTVTVGYCFVGEGEDDAFNNSVDWQDALFNYMNQGLTVKDAFDQAIADYPMCMGYMRFAGDENFAVVPTVERESSTSGYDYLRLSSPTYTVSENEGNATITVIRRACESDGVVSVDYATSNGTATAGQDYTAVSGTLTFNPGETSKTFTVPIVNDTELEYDETINLTLSNSTGGAVLRGPSEAILTILDNDSSEVQFFQPSSDDVMVNENAGSKIVTVSRINRTDLTVTVDYATSDGTATAGEDYTATSGTLTFNPGETSKTFTVPIIDDTEIEANYERINLTLSNPTGGAILGNPAITVLLIADNDGGTLQFSASAYTVNENAGSKIVTVNRTVKTGGTVTVNYATSDGTATAGEDYTATSGTLTFNPGETSKTFAVPILDDTNTEVNETINLTLTNASSGAILGSPVTAVLTIVDNDGGTLQFSASAYTVNENSGTATITVKRLGKTSGVLIVHYATSDGTATAGQDYTATAGTLTFGDGETSKTFTVLIIDDAVSEMNETVNLILSNPVGENAVLGNPSTALLTIVGNDVKFIDSGIVLPGLQDSFIAWGDYDNDGDLDLAICGNSGSDDNPNYITRIYKNNGDNTFTDIEAGLPGVYKSSLAWGDYDNDGDLDLAVCGQQPPGMPRITQIYRNNGGNTFTDIEAGLTGVSSGSLAWGDYDNDGDLDLVLCGSITGSRISRIYKNNGNNTFTDIGAGLTGVNKGSLAWGDYDNDGDLDLALCGYTGGSLSNIISKIYRNNGNDTFTDIVAGLPGVGGSLDQESGSLAWGDYDNDGDLDLALCGYTAGSPPIITKIYRNNGDNTFTDINAELLGAWNSFLAWGDYDNDGDLDLALCGYLYPVGPITRIYKNLTADSVGTPNIAPSAPTNLTYEKDIEDTAIVTILKWNCGSDAETPVSGLYYALRVGTNSGADDIVSGIYGSPLLGNYLRPKLASDQLGVKLKELPVGIYYWSVQTIDTGLRVSEWSKDDIFIIGNPAYYTISGEITLEDGSSDIEDVVLSLTGTATDTVHPDADGSYSFTDLEKGLYIVTPSLEEYHFFPVSRSYPYLDSDQTAQDFTGLHEDYDSDEDSLPDWWELEHFGNLDPIADDDPDADGLTNLEEYQNQMEGIPSDPNNACPQKPTAESPSDMETKISLTPTLQGSEYSDIDYHFATHWQILKKSVKNGDIANTDIVFDDYDLVHKEQVKIPKGILKAGETYYWRLRYRDLYGWSRWSDETEFSTIPVNTDDIDGNGIPDSQQINGYVDMDNNGIDDTEQDDIATLENIVSDTNTAVKTNTGIVSQAETQNANDLPDKPQDYDFPDGVFTFRIDGLTPGSRIEVTFYLSETFTADDKWYKYDDIHGWQDYTARIKSGVGTNTVTLEFKDGDFGDCDGIENGVIVDPSGPAKVVYDGNGGGGSGGGGGCFIATACYGTPMAEGVKVLSNFRDECLLTNPVGTIFVKTYYKVSPPIANFIIEHPMLKSVVRSALKPLIWLATSLNS